MKKILLLLLAGLFLSSHFLLIPAEAAAFNYMSPLPGSVYVHPETSLAVREGRPLDPDAVEKDIFEVQGSRSGQHTGRVVLSDDMRTLLFHPDRPFAFGETVYVNIRTGLHTEDGAPILPASFSFSTLSKEIPPQERSPQDLYEPPVSLAGPTGPDETLYHTHPEFQNLITTTITIPPTGTGSGYLFLTPMGFFPDTTPTAMILAENGEPVYILQPPAGLFYGDLKVVQYGGEEHLAYHFGVRTVGLSSGIAQVVDDTYTTVNSWTIDNGAEADFHDFLVLEDDHVMLLGYLPIPYDLSPYGGPVDGVVYDIVVQEQDTFGNVVFDWHGIDHFPLEDTHVNLSISPADYIHSNAFEIDTDGNILLSSRHLSEITKIDADTGAIIWRMGGAQNEFTFINDIGFFFQHDIRRLKNGNLSLFDNGNLHDPPHSRAVEYAVDEIGKTVTLVWQYPDDTSEFGPFMGNAQRLDNGNTLIGWGGQPKITEALPDRTATFEILISDLTYRAYRFEWSGTPTYPPRAALSFSPSPTTATVYASWNGATDITGYEVYAGPDTETMSLVTTADRSGFETEIPLAGLDPATCVFQVRPVHADMVSTPFSNFVYRFDRPTCWALLEQHFFPLMAIDEAP